MQGAVRAHPGRLARRLGRELPGAIEAARADEADDGHVQALMRLEAIGERGRRVQVALAEGHGLAVALAEGDPGQGLERDREQQRGADRRGDLGGALRVALGAREVLGDGIAPAPRAPRAADEQGGGREVDAVLPRLGQAAVDELVGVRLPLRADERARIAAAQQGGVAAQARRRLGVAERARELDRLEIGVERLIAVHGGVVAARRSSKAARRSAGASASASARSAKRRAWARRGAGGRLRRPRRRARTPARAARRAPARPRATRVPRRRPGRGLVVVGEQVEELVAAVAGQPLEPGSDRGVRPAARTARDRAVGDLAREPVHEGQLALAGQRRGRAAAR